MGITYKLLEREVNLILPELESFFLSYFDTLTKGTYKPALVFPYVYEYFTMHQQLAAIQLPYFSYILLTLFPSMHHKSSPALLHCINSQPNSPPIRRLNLNTPPHPPLHPPSQANTSQPKTKSGMASAPVQPKITNWG